MKFLGCFEPSKKSESLKQEAESRHFWGILKPKMFSLGVLRSHGSLEPLELKRRGDVAWLTTSFSW